MVSVGLYGRSPGTLGWTSVTVVGGRDFRTSDRESQVVVVTTTGTHDYYLGP